MRFLFILSLVCLLSASAQRPREERVLAHSTNFAQVEPARWIAEGWRVDNPDAGASVVQVETSVAFVVTGADSSMAWTLTTEPIWMAPFGTLALSYYVDGPIAPDAGAFIELFDGSTGPITPGATNTENPLASGGRFSCGALKPGLNVALIDLKAAENLERVAEITVTVRSGAEPVAVRFDQLTFLADPVAVNEARGMPFATEADFDGTYTPLQLPEENSVALPSVEEALGLEPGTLPEGAMVLVGQPFDMKDAAATPMNRGGAVVLSGPARGDTLALLCATRLWGSAAGWYSAGSFVPRREAQGAHPFRVLLRYADGTVSVAVPVRVGAEGYGLTPGLGVYIVALDPEKELTEAACVEEMSYGQVVVLGASVRTETGESDPSGERDSEEAVDAARAGELLSAEDTATGFLLEGEGVSLHLDSAGVLQSLAGADGRSWLSEAAPLVGLTDANGEALPLRLVESMASPEGDRLLLVWAVGETPHRLELGLARRAAGGLTCAATLSNGGDGPWGVSLRLPSLSGLQTAAGGTAAYMLGTRSAINDSAPIDVSEVYGGRFPLQFMALYDEAGSGGLACFVLDDTLRRKWFSYQQDDSGRAAMSVEYRDLELAPGERLSLPPAVLLAHEGDWRGPFQHYKAWVQRRFPRVRPNSMDSVFYCRRDYPLGGTSYLYDVSKPGYSFEKLISESTWAFGGIDMVDISGWAYNEQVGRVGTYLQNDLGGLDALAEGVAASHEKGVQVGLYFEGYLLDKRAADSEQGLAEWQLIRAGNEPAWWPGEMEFFCCPGAEGWQEKLAAEIAEVARTTGADAVYVDQLGICDISKECWSASHGHPVPSNPIVEEIALLKRIRAALDAVRPECAIYIEHLPCDAMTPYIDGAFNLGMKHTRHALGPTKLPLHRYLTPDVPIFEMVAHGIRPIPAEADDLKLAFFHGMGLWLKGRGASWYSEGFRALAPAFHTVLQDYADYFRAPGASPHVETLMDGVYANRFPLGDKVLFTLYNSNPITIDGPLLSLGGGALESVVYQGGGLVLSAQSSTLTAAGFFPHEVAAVLVSGQGASGNGAAEPPAAPIRPAGG